MYAPFVVLLVPCFLGALSGDGLIGAVCDEHLDELDEPWLPLAELGHGRLTAGDQRRLLGRTNRSANPDRRVGGAAR